MGTLPLKIKWRTPQSARLGIKSSLSNIRRVVSLAYVLYVCNDKKARLDYSEEYKDGSATKIKLSPYFQEKVESYFVGKDIDEQLAANPLLSSQLEALQVGLELVLQIGKISFVSNKASSAERTGGNRFAKTISFATNIIQIDLLLSAYSEEDRNAFLFSWLSNEKSTTPIENALTSLLAIFTESVKMSISDGNSDVIFEQEGIYKQLIDGQDVLAKDAHEDVGPLRIYKSFVREGLHPYISFDDNDFVSRLDTEELTNYLSLVSTALDLKNSEMPSLAESDSEIQTGNGISNNTAQKIFYGCPGTGKSFEVKRLTEENHGAGVIYFDEDGKRIETPETDEEKEKTPSNIFRTTFHPDYDYATFVGCYKPVMREESIEEGQVVKKLSYEFIPQVFTNAYVRAWKSLVATDLDGAQRNVYLIIEEINRGNCAQIFGDLFQLLDRKDGKSEYPIAPDKDLADYLKEQKVPYERLVLPPNLHIYATMNTSDQSLFPMDSAFKRRWDMEYVAIDYKHPDASKFIFAIGQDKKGNDTAATRHYRWIDFLAAVNAKIVDATSSEDKQMGDFFIRKNISEKEFTNKVMFYLWNDICKELYSPRRVQPAYFLRVGTKPTDGSKDYFTFAHLFDDSNKNSRLLFEFMKYLGLKSIEEPDKKDDDNAPAPDVTQPLNTETPQTQE